MSKVFVTGLAVLLAAGFASANTLEVVSKTIDAGPGQQVLIMVSGTAAIGGVNLNVQIGDGGPDNAPAGVDVGGVTVARMTNIDFRANNSIWGADIALVENPGLISPLLSFGGFGLQAGNKPLSASGNVIATLILDATGVDGKSFDISLAPFGVPSDLGGIPADLIAGRITVIPEPASALLLLAAVPILRRRR